MVTPAAVDRLFAAYLAAHARRAPTDAELAALIASLDLPAQRRAARLYVRGFLRGCDYCEALGNQQHAQDLARLDALLGVAVAFVREMRDGQPVAPPESTS